MDYDAIILGAGGAGLLAAATAGQAGARVLVIDHADKAGKKILISGGGRCNFTNLYAGPENYLSGNAHFCKSALARYTPYDFLALVNKHRIAYHEKPNGQVEGQLFCDDSSKDILNMLLDECNLAGVKIVTDTKVDDLKADSHQFHLKLSGALSAQVSANKVVIATGGLSIPKMGASGWGYEIARQFGHDIVPTRAGLVPITMTGAPQAFFEGLSGVSMPAETACEGQSFSSSVLITHRGLSGPAILQISSYWQPGLDLNVNWLPSLGVANWLQELKDSKVQQALPNILAQKIPARFASQLCAQAGEEFFRPVNQLSHSAIVKMGQLINQFKVIANGTEGYRTAEVTLGGVNVDEVSSQTFESRLQPGLHFIGEVLDVTGHLGGYNFQWAWASAFAAAQAL